MTNVIEFVPKQRPGITAEVLGLLIRDHYLALREKINDPDTDEYSAWFYVVTHFAHSSILEDLELNFWARNNFDVARSGEVDNLPDEISFTVDTEIRTEVVTDFGCPLHTRYLSLTARRLTCEPLRQSPVPDNLFDELTGYVDRFPSISPGNRLRFCYAFLATLLDFPGLKYLGHEIKDGKFFLKFLNKWDDETFYEIEYMADVLPVLLDASALNWAFERLQE